MGKIAQNSVKYVIEAKLKSTGIVEKPDIVGAIFGQTEGLLGEEMDLRELQERGRAGRIQVNVQKKNNKSEASIKIPTSIDATETALLAASLETIERVGPTNADIKVKQIKDQRTNKRDYIVKRAKQLLETMEKDKPEQANITEKVREKVRSSETITYKGFEAGPNVKNSEEIILVEGRADLKKLLKSGVKNTLAIGGTSIPDKITEILEERTITVFVDGDRGGQLIIKELKNKTDLDYVAKAPENKEVEELSKEQINSLIRDKKPAKYLETSPSGEKQNNSKIDKSKISERLNNLIGTRAVEIINKEYETKNKFPVSKFEDNINKLEQCYAILGDFKVDKEKISHCEGVTKFLVGMDKSGYATSSSLTIITREDLKTVKKI